MATSRIKLDNDAYPLQMDRSTKPADYRLFAPFAENCGQCYSYGGPVGSKSDVSLVKKPMDLYFNDQVQIESELSWRRLPLSKNNNDLNPIGKYDVEHKQNCNRKLVSEDTRFTHPIDNYRSMSLTNYQVEPYLHVNPQCHVQDICNRFGLSSRYYAKDNYVIPEQKIIDNGESLPSPIKTENEKDANEV